MHISAISGQHNGNIRTPYQSNLKSATPNLQVIELKGEKTDEEEYPKK